MKAAKQTIRDWDSIPEQYGKAVSMCYALDALTGMSDGTFSGDQTMTRAQACVVITRMKDLTEGKLPSAASQQSAQPETPQQTGSGLLANGQPATVENVRAILEEIKAEYPTGISWGCHDTPGTNYYKDGDQLSDVWSLIGTWADTTYACGGWATMVANGMTLYRYTVTDKNGVEHHDCFYHTCDGNAGHPFYPNDRVVDWSEKENDGVRSALEIGPGTRTRIFTRYPD